MLLNNNIGFVWEFSTFHILKRKLISAAQVNKEKCWSNPSKQQYSNLILYLRHEKGDSKEMFIGRGIT